MAGAGYKLFNTGDVLTAAQVNTYLQEQAVMRFANAAARTTALSGVLAEGMMSYLDDTNSVEVYNGSAWVSIAADQTPLTTKGDLFTYSTADARLAVGNNGESLVADSSTTTGLRWQGDWNTGKNKIINGDFGIWQRGTSFAAIADNSYNADRYKINFNGTGARTVSRETFTPGTAPVSGYESAFFCRINQTTAGTGGSYQIFQQPVEDVRTLAGQTVTLSFWAKADTTRTITAQVNQYFGTGGSPSATVTNDSGNLSLTTAWQRFTYTVNLASLSGKTIGTNNNSFLQVQFVLPFNTTFTIDFWGVQLEAGSVATPFTTATGTLAGELAACQRYYYRTATGSGRYGVGFTKTTTTAEIITAFPVTMRTAPSALEQTGTAGDFTIVHQNTSTALSVVPAFNNANVNMASTNLTVASGLTAGNGCALSAASGNSYLGWSAEL